MGSIAKEQIDKKKTGEDIKGEQDTTNPGGAVEAEHEKNEVARKTGLLTLNMKDNYEDIQAFA